jgi:hypothetical protein
MVRIKIRIQDHEEILELAVSNIGKKDIFIGRDWLTHHNPEMDWKNNQIKFSRCPGECYEESKVSEPEDEIDQFDSTMDKILAIAIDQPEYIRAKSNFATDIADANQVKRSWKEIVPKHYLPYKERSV